MGKNVLITGGAGFIGSHLADELLYLGYRVRVLDNLSPGIHGPDGRRPDYLDPEAEFIKGDVQDCAAVKKAMKGMDAVFHLASFSAACGMQDLRKATAVNSVGTAVLLEAAVSSSTVERVVIASSKCIYGEGLMRDREGRPYDRCQRTPEQLMKGCWEISEGAEVLEPVPTPETKTPSPCSAYALTRFTQESMALSVGRAYGLPVVALRFFNVFGTRQSLVSPHTGALTMFALRLMKNNPPRLYEDGNQMRDFVSVYDAAQACRLALEVKEAAGKAFNVGSGQAVPVRVVADKVASALGKRIRPLVTGEHRHGDVRHCFPDITLIRDTLGYNPKVSFETGLRELAGWMESEKVAEGVLRADAYY